MQESTCQAPGPRVKSAPCIDGVWTQSGCLACKSGTRKFSELACKEAAHLKCICALSSLCLHPPMHETPPSLHSWTYCALL